MPPWGQCIWFLQPQASSERRLLIASEGYSASV